ncbi:MAG: spermidine synthase [Myxococcota bacterium]
MSGTERAVEAQHETSPIREVWAPGIVWSVDVREVLFDTRSEFQHIQVVDTAPLGRVLVLDGHVQCAEGDEAGYHELLVHVGLCRKGSPPGKRRVLVIGGGDGGSAREALRHSDVERVDLVDIDIAVMNAAREFLPRLWTMPDGDGPLDDDPRFHAYAEDGLSFLEDSSTADYDLIVVDASDPIGPGAVLYSPRFYAAIHRRLRRGGAVTVQAGSFQYLPAVLQLVHSGLRSQFEVVRAYECRTSVYPGGIWNLVVATRGDDPAVPDEPRTRALEGLSYYDSANHRAAFVLPPAARDVLAEPPPLLGEVQSHLRELCDAEER